MRSQSDGGKLSDDFLVINDEDGMILRRGRRRRRAAGVGGGAVRRDAGRRIRNVLPLPGSVTTSMSPWCALTIPRTADNPSPRPMNFVVKKGSNIRF